MDSHRLSISAILSKLIRSRGRGLDKSQLLEADVLDAMHIYITTVLRLLHA